MGALIVTLLCVVAVFYAFSFGAFCFIKKFHEPLMSETDIAHSLYENESRK